MVASQHRSRLAPGIRTRLWCVLASTALAGAAIGVPLPAGAQGTSIDIAPVDVTARQRRPVVKPKPKPAPVPVVRAAPRPAPRIRVAAPRRPVPAPPAVPPPSGGGGTGGGAGGVANGVGSGGTRNGATTGSAFPSAAPTPVTAPVGEIATGIGRAGIVDDRPAVNLADVIRNSPGVTVRQGNGPHDVVISIRGNNARSTGGSRNFVVLEDGFPVTQADGFSRLDISDPRAYSGIDVFRGPQSALFGNYATGGALAFNTRRGAAVNGVEYGVDAGSFGYLNNYATVGGVSGPFEISLFTSDARGNGFAGHSSFNTQTINFLGTYAPTTDDRFTLKIVSSEVQAALPNRSSLLQFYQNPYQRGCGTRLTGTPGCATLTLPINGRNGATVPVTADEAGVFRGDRRTIVGGRYEHDFDAFTTWRTQLVFDDRFLNSPVTALAQRGDSPGFNVLSDVTRRGDLFGLPMTGYVALAYNTLDNRSLTYNRIPYGGPRLGALSGDLAATQDNLGGRARIELQLSEQWLAVAGVSAESTAITGRNFTFSYPAAGGFATTVANLDRPFLNTAEEFSLTYRPAADWSFLGRVATGYATPAATNLTVTSAGVPGNNSQLQTQENLGFDLGATWTPLPELQVSVTGFYEFFRNELISQSPGSGLLTYFFNAPASEHRGVEVGSTWTSPEGWRATLAYTHDDQVYTKYTEQLSAGARTARFDRAGRHIPGVPTDAALFRVGYEQPTGPLKGLGAYVETVYQSDFPFDNANLLKAPGFTVVNVNVHYDTVLSGQADAGFAKRLSLYFEVRNLFDLVYTNSAQNLADSIGATTGLQNGAGVLAQTTGSIFASAPRNVVGGMKLAF